MNKLFNKETVNFLKTINKITNSIVLTYPITTGRTESSDIAYMFDLSKFDTDGFETPIGFYDLSNFLNTFNLFDDDHEVVVEGSLIKIKDKTTSVNYLTTAIEVLNQLSFKKEQFDKNETFPSVLEMELTSQDLKKLNDAHSIFKELDTAVISCDEHTCITLTKVGNFKTSSNSFKIEKQEKSEKNFNIGISLDTISKLPLRNYKIIIKYNEERNAYRVTLNTEFFNLVISAKNIE